MKNICTSNIGFCFFFHFVGIFIWRQFLIFVNLVILIVHSNSVAVTIIILWRNGCVVYKWRTIGRIRRVVNSNIRKDLFDIVKTPNHQTKPKQTTKPPNHNNYNNTNTTPWTTLHQSFQPTTHWFRSFIRHNGSWIWQTGRVLFRIANFQEFSTHPKMPVFT